MFKKTSLTALLALILFPAFAQNSLLYKVSGKGLRHPGYLYGTIHLVCEGDLYLSPALKDALKQADSVYFEVDVNNVNQEEMMEGMMGGEGYDMQQHFRPGDFERLKEYMEDSLGMDLDELRPMKPMVLQVILGMYSLGCTNPSSYETALNQLAAEHKKTVKGLETAADQIAIFRSVPDSTQVNDLMELLNEPGKLKNSFNKIVAAYKRQDLDALYALRKESPESPAMEEMLLSKRNRKWVPVIEKAMRHGRILVACGAMHLPGEEGLIALLKAQGYTVTPVL
jgi:uncharacterized protein YbaP (TraB family)